jgi:hypothetical protein
MKQFSGVANEEPKPKFWGGRLVITLNALKKLVPEDIQDSINRHLSGDWGDLTALDKGANKRALEYGGRLFSIYRDRKGVKFWITTESDRITTTVRLRKITRD